MGTTTRSDDGPGSEERRGAPRRGGDARRNPQAPEETWLRRLLGRYHVTGAFWYRAYLWALRVVPERLYGPAIMILAGVFSVVLVRIRHAIAANLARVLGPAGVLETQRRVYRTCRAFSWCLTERYEVLCGGKRPTWDPEGVEHWESTLASDEGFILATAHIGNWEGASVSSSELQGRTVHIVREAEMDPKVQAFLEAQLEKLGAGRYRTHFAADDGVLGVELLTALRAGDVVALQSDRPRAGGPTVELDLFGQPTRLPAGIAVLARAAQVAILPVFAFRESRLHYRCVFGEPIRVARTRDRGADVEEAVTRIARGIESAVRRRPHQWFCFNRLWPDPPRENG